MQKSRQTAKILQLSGGIYLSAITISMNQAALMKWIALEFARMRCISLENKSRATLRIFLGATK